jgi:hypothetical protein
MLVVYLHTGERREIPRATRASIVGDRLLCLAKWGKTLAQFPAPDVYLCSAGAMAAVPA